MADNSDNLKQSIFAVSEAVLGAGVLVALGTFGGGWLDEKFHTQPWFSISLSIIGAGLGLARLVIKAQQINQTEDPSIPRAKQTKDGPLASDGQPRSPYAKWDDQDS